jgi:hypothetical protein
MHRRLLAVAPLLLLLAACDRLVQRAFQAPTVEFRGAALRSAGLGGGVVDVQLLLRNPNPYPLTASSATYRVFAGDSVEVGQGMTNDTVVVAGRDSALVRLPLNVTWRALNAAGRQALADGTVDYLVSGEVVGVTPVGDHAFPVNARGRARLPVPGL